MYAISSNRVSLDEREAVQKLAPQPRTILETGLADNFLGDLVCKHLYDAGVLDMVQLVARLALTGAVMEEILTFLRKDRRVEVLGQAGGQAMRYGLTERGRNSARDALARSGYIGAAPYPVSAYRSLLKLQTIHHGRISAHDMHHCFGSMVLAQSMLDQLGVALNSGRAIMIYGPAGTGKTYVSSRLIRLFAEAIWVPHAIAINESVIEIYDPQVHRRLGDDEHQNVLMLNEGIDRRLLCCERPIVITGGELTMEQLDVRYDPYTRQYQAPLQLKASNGLLIIDDLGRQRMTPGRIVEPLDCAHGRETRLPQPGRWPPLRAAVRPDPGVLHQPQSAGTGRRSVFATHWLQAAIRLPQARRIRTNLDSRDAATGHPL